MIAENFRRLPISMKSLFLLFSAIPALSSLLSFPELFGVSHNGLRATLYILTYWCLPASLCYCLLVKRHWFLPAYFIQCLALALHSAVATFSSSAQVSYSQYALIGLMAYIGVLMGNRNFLYPLLSKDFRHWRKSLRYRVGKRIMVSSRDWKKDFVPAILHDCSKTGAKLGIMKSDLGKHYPVREGAQLNAIVEDPSHPTYQLPLAVVWVKEGPTANVILGLKSTNEPLMESFVAHEVAKTAEVLTGRPNVKQERDVHETALVLWIVCIALSFALPALSTVIP